MEDLENPISSLSPHMVRRPWWFFHLFGLLFFMTIFSIIILGRSFRVKTPEFVVNSMFLSSNYPEIKGNWNVNLCMKNPNPDTYISYNQAQVWLFYKETFISTAHVMPFYQGTGDGEILTVHANLGMKTNEIKEDVTEDRVLIFDLSLEANIRVNSQSFLQRKRFLIVECNDLRIEFPLNQTIGTLSGGQNSCRVQLYGRKPVYF